MKIQITTIPISRIPLKKGLKFLDTKIIYEDNQIKTKVHRNERKIPVHWTSKIPKRYKRKGIKADLNRAARMASTFAEEMPKIKQKFLSAHYPPGFVKSVIKQFNEKSNDNTRDITLYRQISLMSLNS